MNKNAHKEHGTVSSYVVGFALSIIFTIIPYYMVINKLLTGNTLLVAILSIAIVQMFIQIFFFLHLGRGPKPLYNVVFFFATAGMIIVVVGASLFIMENLYRTMSPKELTLKQAQRENISQVSGNPTGACTENKNNYVITIRNGLADPSFVQASLCDTITFTNEDAQSLTLNFGDHKHPTSYGGEDEVTIDASDSEIITLNQTGTFTFFDHHNNATRGSFSVAPLSGYDQ